MHHLDRQETASAGVATELPIRHQRAARAAVQARHRVRDRDALVSRYASQRAQYNDDIRKLTLLHQAGSIFDHLSVRVYPACLNTLANLLRSLETRPLDLRNAGPPVDVQVATG